MDKQVFENRFMKIIGQFGPKQYSQDRVTLIYNEVKAISLNDLDRVITLFLGSWKTAPLVPDFKKAIFDLNIKSERTLKVVDENFTTRQGEEDYLYHIRDNVWANNDYILVRGKSVRECGFIIKQDYPHNPVVKESLAVHAEKIKEVKEHLKNNTYAQFENAKVLEFRTMDFSGYLPTEGA